MTFELPNLTYEFKPTNECFNWCKDKATEFFQSEELSGLWIIAWAMVSLAVSHLIISYGSLIVAKSNYSITEQQLEKYSRLLNNFAFYLLAGFFIWYYFFRAGG